jgi:hypothetical protein
LLIAHVRTHKGYALVAPGLPAIAHSKNFISWLMENTVSKHRQQQSCLMIDSFLSKILTANIGGHLAAKGLRWIFSAPAGCMSEKCTRLSKRSGVR